MVKFGVTDPQNLMVILLTNLKATVFTSKEDFHNAGLKILFLCEEMMLLAQENILDVIYKLFRG